MNRTKFLKRVPAFFLLLLLPACAAYVSAFPRLQDYEAGMDPAGKRFLVPAKIDGKPVTLALDTGTETLFLFKPAVKRLGLNLSGIPSDSDRQDGKFPVLQTRPHNVTLFNTTARIPLWVTDFSVPMDVDGCAGWPLFKNSIFQIDAAGQKVRSLPAVPEEARQWTKLRLRHGSDVLCLEIPGPHKNGVILIDTGNDGGVSLNAERWRAWTNAQPNYPKTLTAYYMGGSGVVIGEESWAETLSLGPVTLNEVPVRGASASDVATGSSRSPYQATLGLVALERLDLIVDGKAGVAYVHARTGPFRPYPYNRAGAVFTLRDPGKSKSDLVAHVLEGSPAYDAGIRTGDVVTAFDGKSPRNGSGGPMTVSRTSPAGTKLELTLKRGTNTFTATMVLRDLFPPAASGTSEPVPDSQSN